MAVGKNSNGVWYFKVSIKGKQYKRENRNWRKKDAEYEERKFLMEHDPCADDVTLRYLHNRMIAELKNSLKEKSIYNYNYKLQCLGSLADIPISKITTKDIKEWQSSIAASHYGLSVGYIQSYMRRLINYGYNNEIISADKLARVPYAKGGNSKKLTRAEFYTIEQFNELMSVVDNPQDILIYNVLFYCGLRIGELLALQVRHIIDNKIIIEQTQGVRRTNEVSSPKTKNSYRTVLMDSTTSELVNNWIKDCDSEAYVVTRSDIMLDHEAFRKRHFKYLKKTKLPPIKVHGLRHSHVSLLINNGFNAHEVAARIGDSVRMVNEVYGHLYENSQQKIVEAIDNLNRTKIVLEK